MARTPASRSVLTVLFTDIVGSTALAAKVGDARWREMLDAHDAMVRERLAAAGGKEVKTVGDGFVATFTSPTAGVRCAQAIVSAAPGIGLGIRAGLHTGEVERRGRDVGGISVHIAARVAALAGAGEVIVSATVRDVCEGSGISFTENGTHALAGVPGRRRVFLVSGAAARRSRSAAHPPSARPRVVVVDDHPLWRQTLRGLLESEGVATVVGEADDGEAAIETVRATDPDVVLMDVDMPGLDGIEATRRIAADGTARVLVLSSLKGREEVLTAVRAGAFGYLLKTAEGDAIADAIRRVHGGEMAFPPELTGVVLEELRRPQQAAATEPHGALQVLTERERSVLELMASGRSNQAIARALHVAPKTLESHIASIFSKLQLDDASDHHRRVQAVVAYLRSQGIGATP